MWQWLTTNGQQLSLLVTTLSALLTALVVILMWRANHHMRLSIAQSARAEEGRSRPFHLQEYDVGKELHEIQDIVRKIDSKMQT
jgi:hypothetical protein